jgi:hippurate hydrolase
MPATDMAGGKGRKKHWSDVGYRAPSSSLWLTWPNGIRRTAQGVALAAGVPEDRAPIVTVYADESTPPTYNDPALTARMKAALVAALGAQNVFDEDPIMGSEDFGLFGLPGHKIPTVIFWLGAMDPAKFAAAETAGTFLPGPHTSRFEPLPEPTLRTGVIAMTVATALPKR